MTASSSGEPLVPSPPPPRDVRGRVGQEAAGRHWLGGSALSSFLEAGGVIEELPPQQLPPRPKHKPAKRQHLHDSGFAREQIPKGEALANRINLQSPDWAASGGGKGRRAGITAGEIMSALANSRLTEFERLLAIWYYTQDPSTRGAVFALLLRWLIEQRLKEKWDVRRRGIMTKMVEIGRHELETPAAYQNLSDRQWADMLGLADHKDWSQRWGPRYRAMMSYAWSIVSEAEELIKKRC